MAEQIASLRVQVTSVKLQHATNKTVVVEASNTELMSIRFVTSATKAPKALDNILVTVSETG